MGSRRDVETGPHMFSTKQANHANYATAGLALVILLLRLVVGRLRGRPIDFAFYLIVTSIVVVTARITLNWYQLRLGTINDAISNPNYFETHTPSNVVKGSKILLAARETLTCCLWLQICLLLLFYWQILQGKKWVKILITATWVAAGISFVIVTLFTFLECRPIHLYWQVDPEPGRCAKSYNQLLSQCVSNVVLDLMLLAISFPILLHRSRSRTQYCQIGLLYLLGTLCIVVTVMRLKAVFSDQGEQAARTLWGAVQIIVSTFVANVPTTYGDVNVVIRRKKEIKRRRSSRPESWTRTSLDEEAGVEASTLHNDVRQEFSNLQASSRSEGPKDVDEIEAVTDNSGNIKIDNGDDRR